MRTLRPETLVIDFSTIGPKTAREISQRVKAETGASWLDCPVSGGVVGASAGSLIVLAGGDSEDLRRAEPVLDAVSSKVTRMGGVGAGQAAKLSNQLIVSTNLVAIAEAMELGRALGVDVQHLPEALKGGFADSLPLQIFGPSMTPEGEGLSAQVLSVMHKDVREIVTAAETSGASAELMLFVDAVYRAWLTDASAR
jgi:3-hydroxyisobutyrate dehydrogenase/2-hydroxy-3-oxopropionate reductase